MVSELEPRGLDAARLQAQQRAIRQAIKAEREQCCRDECPWCADGDTPYRISKDVGPWYHLMPGDEEDEVCCAWLIHERAAREAKEQDNESWE